MNYKRIVELLGWFAVGWCIHRIGTLLLHASTRLANANSTLNDLEKAVARLEEHAGVAPHQQGRMWRCRDCGGSFALGHKHYASECQRFRMIREDRS